MSTSSRLFSVSRSALTMALLSTALARCVCAPEPPTLIGVDVGTIVGAAIVQDPTPRRIGGAVASIRGVPATALTEDDRQFVLSPVPLGEFELTLALLDGSLAVRTPVAVTAPFETVVLPESATTLRRAAAVTGTVTVAEPVGSTAFVVGGSQTGAVGADGTFRVEGIPVGPAQIGVAKPGFDTLIVDVTLGEGDNAAPAITLVASAVNDLTLLGSVTAVGETDQRGTVVVLNGGTHVVSTNEEGAFRFDGLSPGQITLRAERPGFSSVELPGLALDGSGQVFGLVPMFLTPGQDDVIEVAEGEGEGPVVDPELTLQIDNPGSGDAFFVGDELVLGARADGNVAFDEATISWGYRAAGSTDALTVLGVGVVLAVGVTPTLPAGQLELVASLSATDSSGLVATDSVTILVNDLALEPVFSARVDETLSSSAFALPQIVDDNGTARLTISETQPVFLNASATHPLEGDLSDTIEWTSDTGFLFIGPAADLSSLNIGTHTFTVSVEDSRGRGAASTVVVTVIALDFTVTVLAPLETAASPAPLGDPNNNPPYFRDLGVPLIADIRHPFQRSFPVGAVTWRDESGAVVASGPITTVVQGGQAVPGLFRFNRRTTQLSAGPHVVTATITDLLGNVRAVGAPVTVVDAVFTATFVAPAADANIEQGDPLVLGVDVNHSLVDASVIPVADLSVTFSSNLQGPLTANGGGGVFEEADRPTFTSLVVGNHVITARVLDGRGGIATATRNVTVRRPGVVVNLLSPADEVVLFPGQTVLFQATAVEDDVNDDPTFRWTVDGAEFDATWDDYGVDPANPGRLTINLGAFAVGTGIFADPRWAPGARVVEFCATLGANPPTCASVDVFVPDSGFDLCPSTTARSIFNGTNEVWSGIRRLNCDVTVDGGTLTVLPGTRVIVDDLASGQRGIFVGELGGHLLIGDINAAERVVFSGSVDALDVWEGIELRTPSSVAALVRIEKTTFRNTDAAIDPNNSGDWDGINNRLEVRDLEVLDSRSLWTALCPDVVDGVSFDGGNVDLGGNPAIGERTFGNDCLQDRAYRGIRVANADAGMNTTRAGVLTIEDSEFINIKNEAIHPTSGATGVNDFDSKLIVRRTTFESVGRTGARAALRARACAPLRVEDSIFIDNNVGIDDDDECRLYRGVGPRIDIVRSLFEANFRGLTLNNGAPPEAELHLSAFVGNTLDIEATGINVGSNVLVGADINAQGNFLGLPGDLTSAGGVALAAAPGTLVNLPKITDFFDGQAERLVRVEHALPAVADALDGLAYFTAPSQAAHHAAGECIQPALASPFGEVGIGGGAAPQPVAPVTDCTLSLVGSSGDPNGLDLTAVTLDGDGCITNALPAGPHTLAAHCDSGGLVQVLTARFLVDASRRSGVLAGPALHTWSGEVILDGDVTVPAGTTLVIEPGTVVRMAASDRLRSEEYRNNPMNPNGSDTGCSFCFDDTVANSGLGQRDLVDIIVEGTLVAQGTAQQPIRFVPEVGAGVKSLWGGIQALLRSQVQLSFVDIEGPDIGVHAEFAPIDPFSEPIISLDDSTIAFARVGMRGACPQIGIARNTFRSVERMDQLMCSSSFAIVDSTFVDIGDPAENPNSVGDYFTFANYSAGGAATLVVSVQRSSFTRLGGVISEMLFANDTDGATAQFVFDQVDVDGFAALVEMDSSGPASEYAISVTDSRVTRFDILIRGVGGVFPARYAIDRSDLSFGNAVVDLNHMPRTVDVDRTRITSVVTPFRALRLGDIFSFTVNGCQIESCGTVFELRPNGVGGAAAHTADLSGNNFVGNTRVVDVAGVDADTTISADATGCFWNTASTATIETLINDAQTDQGVDFDGRTNYALFSSTPLTLDLLP